MHGPRRPELPPPTASSDAAGASEAGASAAQIERLFREHNAALLRFVAAKLGSEQEAREVAQEAYVKLLSLDRPEAVSYLRGFLFKTAANLALDRLRQRGRRRTEPFTGESDWRIFDLSPERELQSAQTIEVLRIALDELPGKCRQAFIMHRVHELSCAEIMQRLGISERSVRLYVARAIQHLRARLDQEERSKRETSS